MFWLRWWWQTNMHYTLIQPMINTPTKWRVLVKKNYSQDDSGRYCAYCINVWPNIAINSWKQCFSYQFFVSRTIQHLIRCAPVCFFPLHLRPNLLLKIAVLQQFPKTHRIAKAHMPCTNLYKSAASYSQSKWNPPFHVCSTNGSRLPSKIPPPPPPHSFCIAESQSY